MDQGDRALFPRFAAEVVVTALRDTPVVMVTGPRQCGKTTLVRYLVASERKFITMDDDTVLAAARSDPTGLVRDLDRTTIDEVQRAPDLLRAIKRSVDEDRRAGRFLLTGSANVLTLPQVSESLAGRIEIISLLPLSQSEIRGRKPNFLRAAFAGKVDKPAETMIGQNLVEAVLIGGYPEMLRRKDARRRRTWALDYVKAIVQRDVREIAEVEKLDQMPRLLRVLANHTGQLTNFTQIGGQIGFDDKTTRKYVGILEQLFLVRRVEPWFRNRLKRSVKTPKLHFLDSGLLSALLGATAERVARDRAIFGPLLETFVFAEVQKHASWSDESYALYHYRDKDQDEVDLVIEMGSGSLIGVEVKAAASVNATDFKGLRKLAGVSGDDFKVGIVLYDGEKTLTFGDHLFAAPISCLWG
ncbi:MAG TPA: ATP-binding protein [Candidatus Dormibacteraeota bacterium]|nr:ATP-binding protein [Candidatus Dormibacteraeota bacterium]